MFVNKMPRYEILSADAIGKLDAGWRRIVTEIGVEFMSDRALELLRAAGQKVEDNKVFLDPEFVLAQAAKAPREFDIAARNPAQSVHIGGDAAAFGGRPGPPRARPSPLPTRRSRGPSVATRWPSGRSTGPRSCVRARSAGTGRWTT